MSKEKLREIEVIVQAVLSDNPHRNSSILVDSLFTPMLDMINDVMVDLDKKEVAYCNGCFWLKMTAMFVNKSIHEGHKHGATIEETLQAIHDCAKSIYEGNQDETKH